MNQTGKSFNNVYSLTGWKIGWENVWPAMLGTYGMTGGKMFFRPAGCLKYGGLMENARNSTNRGLYWTLAGRVTYWKNTG